jgi:ribonuclease Z
VISGDTAAHQNLVRAATGADILVHDALNPQMIKALEEAMTASGNRRAAKIMRDIPDYHASPIEAAQIANAAGARLLVLTHMLPYAAQ